MAKKNKNKKYPEPLKNQETLGSTLRAARVNKGLSPEEIHTRTRIPLSAITNLETDNHEELPAPVYVRGFIKLFAREVGLDYNTVVGLYSEKSEHVVTAKAVAPLQVLPALSSLKGDDQGKDEKESRVSTALVVFILLILATLAISYFSSQKESSSSSSSPSAQEAAHFDVTG